MLTIQATDRRPGPPTPELDRLSGVSQESQAIGAFLDWLTTEHGVHLCETCGEDDYETYEPTHQSIERILAAYYQIDLSKVEDERRALLEWIRDQPSPARP